MSDPRPPALSASDGLAVTLQRTE
ncbi:MAG: hypothetical protein JWR41_46, partial [Modestobacter sp.]|nr:hypothetical protein [Modestobacter sp.]